MQEYSSIIRKWVKVTHPVGAFPCTPARACELAAMGCGGTKAAAASSPRQAEAPKPTAGSSQTTTDARLDNGHGKSSSSTALPDMQKSNAYEASDVAGVAPPAGTDQPSSQKTAAPKRKSSDIKPVDMKAGSRRLAPGGKSKYDKVISAAVAFIAARVRDKGWTEENNDVAFSCKAPLALVLAGYDDFAVDAMQVAASQAASGGGRSSRDFYRVDYPQSPWLWICWAATTLSDKGANKPANDALADKCYRQLRTYSHPILATGLLSEPYKRSTPCRADYLATGMLAKAALLREDWECAELAGDALLRALEANRDDMAQGCFRLRWTWDDGFSQSDEPRCCVHQSAPNQLYFMLGFPAYVLIELASCKFAQAKEFQAAADCLLAYLKSCKYIFSDPSAHAVAGASAATRNKETKAMATKICEHLVSLQKNTGCFQEDPESAETFDQACEISIWLSLAGSE